MEEPNNERAIIFVEFFGGGFLLALAAPFLPIIRI